MQIKRIISITLVLIVLISTFFGLQNTSEASTYLIDEADLYSKGSIICVLYKESIRVEVQFVVYKKDGVEYPAYCLNRNLPGVTETDEYTVTIDGLVSDAKIWRAVNNGYPFVSAASLGCNSDIEAYAATKLAVYDMMYDYDWDDFSPLNEQGERVLAAAKSISTIARNSSETKQSAIVTVKTDDESWQVDDINGNYASKTFYVETNVESTEYTVSLKNLEIENVKVVDENNEEKTSFSANEKFKVLIPISEMNLDGSFSIEVTANMKTRPILYGKSADSTKQSYALAAGEYEYESSNITVNYLKNSTKIEILKKDAETGEALAGAKFNILNENNEIVYSDLTTNDEGIAEIEGIMPGKYYVQEVKSPDGYIISDELIEIDIELNQTYTIDVNNYKESKEEEKEVESKSKTVYGTEEVSLPRTGF